MQENKTQHKVEIHLDGKDFQGYLVRLVEVVLPAVLIGYWANVEPMLLVGLATIYWMVFFGYKISHFKEQAYQDLVEELQAKNERLEKTNQLLTNGIAFYEQQKQAQN